MMSEKELAEIRRRLEETTPGDWRQGMYNFDLSNLMVFGGASQAVASTVEKTYPVVSGWDTERDWENAYFIAHSKGYVQSLLDEIERLKTSEGLCQWINHCSRKPEFVVAEYEELLVCGPCLRQYGLNDGDYWKIPTEGDEE